jgi:hypothetical protein
MIIAGRNEIVELIAEAIALYQRSHHQLTEPTAKGDEQLLTRKEAAAFLKISHPTLDRYTKEGIVNGRRIGQRILYSKDDLMKCGRSLTSLKYRKRND